MNINDDTAGRNEFCEKVKNIEYKEFTAECLKELKPYYEMRPNKSCDSAPLCQYVFKYYYRVKYARFEDALILMFENGDGERYGFLPYCSEDKIAYYFKLQEAYFNKVIGMPLNITCADEEGVKLLKEAGVLDNYEITEIQDAKDYLYDAESIRTLAGRKYSKKRNHINKFMQTYEGRWEYRSLTYEDRHEILEFLRHWLKNKENSDEENGINEEGRDFDAILELEAEFKGIQDIVNNEELFDVIKIGGIFVDGRLEAFSMGDYNEREKLAIIDVEKGNEEIHGIYQMINQQFALNEYPNALIVNREDDVGIEGLRKAKMSYHPSGFEHKYLLKQKV